MLSLKADATPATKDKSRPDPARRREIWLGRLDLTLSPYLLVSPFFLVFAVFGLFPLGYTLWISLHDWDIGGSAGFVGLDNYTRLMRDSNFWNAAGNTLGMFVVSTVPQLLLALVIAAILNRKLRFRMFFRLAVVIPVVTSVAAVAIVFGQLFAHHDGIVNQILHGVGLTPVDWEANKWSSWFAVSTMINWRWTGYNALIYLAAMQAIPRDLYESAELDGAGAIRQFRTITVPMIRPALVFTVIVSTIGGMQLFTEPLIFGHGRVEGGSLRQFQTLAMYMFEQSFRQFHFGYGAAVAWMIFLVIGVVGAINFLITRRVQGDDS